MPIISRRDILKQLKADLIGKDSYRGVTLTYSWLANQFGHFALGFIPVFLLYEWLLRDHSTGFAIKWATISICILWPVFESYNFLGPLLLKRSTRHVKLDKNKNYTFQPDWKNVGFDTLTDVGYFWLGSLTASIILGFNWLILIFLVAIIVLLIYPSYYWFTTKMFLQSAQYPSQYRLSQWNFPLNDEGKQTVTNFLNNKDGGKHVLLFGAKGSGKTSLGIGIGTELSIKRKPCSYTTSMKLFSLFFDQAQPVDNQSLWTWRNASLLIIDDVNPGYPILRDLVTPSMFLNFIDTLGRNDRNRETIKQKNTIWVLGNENGEEHMLNSWKKMLEEIGVAQENILPVNLGMS
ncbi:MAG: ATP-binding protein [Chitinophagaceae bacterium]|nr:ATP-binding protein [Chitinophagaceae bacterium]